ncbi:transposase : Transposase OS=Agrobacterium vitis (strain S4 / ATCC BAA-846) GN=tnp PE=4 SV=1: Tnp_DNA_bind [Gemmata massiliana]|uniref:Transposase Tn5-like N-terminal domain-containing protein n=1 Tax=Gemmata massiliana TaxID=1210884 RepID=A0A6P2D299_9BACT|nr:transposase DNA-binding-containing protein [Gemmata massiliana]VTR93562.1 transposase : Transposase OS=Agrobacterium vitis (strain S4 / ATCC BAA-846) GN=tnp PE=4 SV=1: Tnp_DNA_bind [Gemmata massiliana]
MDAWVKQELNAGVYPDRRLQSRLGQLLGDLGRRFGDTIPLATQDWAGAKAAYRFLSNPRVDEACILSGHLAATRARFDASPGTVLVLHDTTEFSFQRRDREADIYELFCAAHDARTHFLIRTCVDRFAGRGNTTVSARMAREPVRGEHAVEVRDDHGRVSTATLRVRSCRITVHPPVAKRKRYLARAKDPPPGNEVIWRGLSRLADISLGAELMDQSCG